MQRIKGLSYLEILISLFVLSLWALNFNATQILANKLIHNLTYYAIASQEVLMMNDRLTHCKEMVCYTRTIKNWQRNINRILPSGRIIVTEKMNAYDIRIFWGNNKNKCRTNLIGMSTCLQMTIYR